MFSRIREDVRHVFDCFCEVAPADDRSANKQPWIVSKFPDSYNDETTLKMVPMFVFPCEIEYSTVQHSSFVLTSIDSKWTFGFCRHSPNEKAALVLLSALPWHDAFFKLLNTISRLSSATPANCSPATVSSGPADPRQPLITFLQQVYTAPVPDRGGPLAFELTDGSSFSVICTDHLGLPCIPQDRNLTEYFNAVDTSNMMVMFASMLYERRIIVTSRRLSRLSACVQAANAIIYPMSWQHIFIPILPGVLIDYLSAPMPFLIGVPATLMQRVRASELGEAVVLDADANRITTPFSDLDSLPADVVNTLKRNLKNPNNMLGDRVARCFLRALVQLIGGYRDALRFPQNCSKITFDSDLFIHTRPSHMRPFLEEMLQLQIFDQFICERLEMLNSGQGFSDEFELEACVYLEKSSSRMSKQYREWLSSVKKDGGILLKNFRSITNPAIKSAMRNVVETSRSGKHKMCLAYRDLRGRIKENHNCTAYEGDNIGGSSAPGSPSTSRRRSLFNSKSASNATIPRKVIARNLAAACSEKVRSSVDSSDHYRSAPPMHYDIIDSSVPLRSALRRPDTSSSSRPLSPVDGFSDFCPSSGSSTLVDEMNAAISKIEEKVSEDLIKLDSPLSDSSDIFDPLKTSSSRPPATIPGCFPNHSNCFADQKSDASTVSILNPIYQLHIPRQRTGFSTGDATDKAIVEDDYLVPDCLVAEQKSGTDQPQTLRIPKVSSDPSLLANARRHYSSADNLYDLDEEEPCSRGVDTTKVSQLTAPALPPKGRDLAGTRLPSSSMSVAAVISRGLPVTLSGFKTTTKPPAASAHILTNSPTASVNSPAVPMQPSAALVPPRPVFRSVASIRQQYETWAAPPPLPPKCPQKSAWTTFD